MQAITAEPIVGETYEGPVKSTTAFGAFVEIMPGTEGLVHISELQWGRTEKTEDVVKKGDRVKVKLIERDERGRLRLSMKALVPKPGADEAGAGTAAPAVESSSYAEGDTAPDASSADGESAPREDRGGRGGSRGGRGGGGRGRGDR